MTGVQDTFKILNIFIQLKSMIEDKQKLMEFLQNIDESQVKLLIANVHILKDKLADIKNN